MKAVSRLLVLAIYFGICINIFAQDKNVILFEDFEKGIPATWTQEYVRGNDSWIVESGTLTNPQGTTSGSKRIAFRNSTNQTTANVTRLVLPEMNLAKVFHPILCFSYAQDKWAGDFDTLRILYRRSPSSNWLTLKTYDSYSSLWQRDTIRLVAVTSTYQVAFEAKDNLGRGIVLDDVEVRSIPNCTQPFNLTVSKIKGTSVRLEWAGSFDALKYHVKVSKSKLSVDELYTNEHLLDYEVDGEEYSLDIDGLEPATKYYFYVQSECVGENSDWSDAGEFVTSDLLRLPYFESFNLDYIENTTSSVPNWFCYSINRGAVPPFVNTNQLRSERLKYSPDSTTALFFYGATNTETPIRKGAYSYACLPELYVDSINNLQVTFWTINNSTTGLVPLANSCKILVGVMSDPENKNTFVAVDTIEVTSEQDFEEIFVSFENYKGDGKYITFMSDFNDGTNAFVIDNLLVEPIPTTPKAKVQVILPEADALEVKFTEKSELYEVVVSNAQLDVSKIDNKKVVKRQVFSSENCRIEGLYPWVTYFVYGRHINTNDTGAWSNVSKILMPEEFETLPSTITFDINTFDVSSYYTPGKSTYKMCNGLLALTNSISYPTSTQQFWTEDPDARSPWELSMESSKVGSYQMVVFPELIDPSKTKVTFYATRHLVESGAFAVGILSDANDVESFQAIDTVVLDQNSVRNKYDLYTYDLSKFDFVGKFFAIKVAYDYCGSVNKIWIDDVRFFDNDGCLEPTGLVANVQKDRVTISWQDNSAESWNVLLSRTEYSADVIDQLSKNDYFAKQTTTSSSVTFEGLETGEKTYYYYVQSICSGKAGIWSLPQSFKTECLTEETVPYTMNFDDAEWFASSYQDSFPVPCLYTIQEVCQGDEPGDVFYYPHLSTSVATTGEKSLLLGSSEEKAYGSYIAFPQMVENLNKLQISWDMIADSLPQVIEVGVMKDPLDTMSFDLVETIVPSITWKKHVVKFNDYTEGGRYIAFRTAGKTNKNFIDNINISYISASEDVEDENDRCQTPNVNFSDISKTTANIVLGSKADLFNLIVSSRELSLDERNDALPGGDILVAERVSTQKYSLINLKSNTPYHVYVQAICSDTLQSAWFVGHFYTECDLMDTYNMGVESFEYYGVGEGFSPNCYIVGNLNTEAPTTYVPYCSDEYSHTGRASLKLASNSQYDGAYAIVPEIDVDSISRLRVRFWASTGECKTSQYARKLIVAVLTDPSNLAYEPIATLDVVDGEGLEYEVRFDEYEGDFKGKMGRYVMFLSYGDKKSNNVYIDDIKFDTIPQCVSPKVKEVVDEPNRIVLQLYNGTGPYQVKYIVGDYSATKLEEASVLDVTNDSFEINGLSQNTECYVVVRSSCGGGYSDWSPVMRFVTASLTSVSVPYYDSFEQNVLFGEYSNPLDWITHYVSDDVDEQYRYPYVTIDRAENEVVYLYSDATLNVSYMVTPKFEGVDLRKCQVSFKCKPDVASQKTRRAIVVGFVSDVTSRSQIVSTFVPVDTIFMQGSTLYNQVVVPLSSYTGSAKHIAFMVSHSLNRAKVTDQNGTYGGCYIDDVLVELMSSCQRPLNFTLTSLGDTYASFKFSHQGAIKYEVKYGLKGFDVSTAGNIVEISDTSFVINGLRPNTMYDFYVRAYCSETDVSEWSLCESYTTFEVPVSIFPYINNFSDVNENLQFTTLDSYINKWYLSDSLFVSGDNGMTATYQHQESKVWAYRTFDLKEGVYTVSFDWKAKGDNSDFMRVMLIPALSQFAAGNSEVSNFDGTKVTLTAAKQLFPNDWIDLGRSGQPFNMSQDWETYTKTFLITPEMAGFYRLVIYWENDEMLNGENNMSAAIDNLLFEKSDCSYPYNFQIEDISSTYLTLSWTPIGIAPKSYNVIALTKEMNPDLAGPQYIASLSSVMSNTATIGNLSSGTDYYIYIQANCDGDEQLSFWSECFRFTTPCDPKPLGTVFSFELDEGYYLPFYSDGEPNTSYRIPDCFVNGHSNAEETPYIVDNTVVYPHSYMSGIYQVARTGDYALKLYSNSEEKIGGYMALPLIDGNFDELQVSFWIRPFGAVKGTDNVNSIGLNAVYARKVTVGTMTNPNDPSTFEPLQVVSYPYTTENKEMASGSFVYEDVEKTSYWRKHTVLLKGAKGKFIAFKNEMYDGKENNQMYIDDIVVDYVSDCMTPSSLMVEEATATTAKINAETNGGSMFEVQISLKEDFHEIWRTDTITGFPATLKNLLPGQDYFIRVKQICGATNQSEWSSAANCITAYSTLYSTSQLGVFNTQSYVPRHWQRSCGTSAADIFSKAGSAMITDPSLPLGWTVKNGRISTYVTTAETRATNPYCWLFSSSIELPNTDVTMLFDLALTDDDGVHKPDSTISNVDDVFYVVVSENNGRSWEEHNKFTWTNNNKGDFEYNSIPVEGATYSLDLTKYAGKVIRLAFYSECTSGITSELHISNIRINSVVSKDIEATICQTEDFYYRDFVKVSEELQIGQNQFIYHQTSQDNLKEDTICNISLEVKPMSVKHIDAWICDGEVYSQNNFASLTKTGVYKRKLSSAKGCDSVVVVDLKVYPVSKTLVSDTICFGSTYFWNGKEYNRTGVYVDTLQSVVTGCDSIATLLLKVKDAPKHDIHIDLCVGQTYQFGSRIIDSSGVYTETFTTPEGCDSIVTLTVKVAEDLTTTFNEFICVGETYTNHGFKGVPVTGTYTLPLVSSGGCDSTIVLNLYVLNADTIYVKQNITLGDLPYVFLTRKFDENTPVGIYEDEFFVERENCSAVVKYELKVGEEVSVENIEQRYLVIYPNPIVVGEYVNIEGEFSMFDSDDVVIEIYDMLGSCIYREKQSSDEGRIVSELAISNRGIYMVVVTSSDGSKLLGKIIVK